MISLIKTNKFSYSQWSNKVTIKKSFFFVKKVKFKRLKSSFGFRFNYKNSVSLSKFSKESAISFIDFFAIYSSQENIQQHKVSVGSLLVNKPFTNYSLLYLKIFKIFFQQKLSKTAQVFINYKSFISALNTDIRHITSYDHSFKTEILAAQFITTRTAFFKDLLNSNFDSSLNSKINNANLVELFFLNVKPYVNFSFKVLFNNALRKTLRSLLSAGLIHQNFEGIILSKKFFCLFSSYLVNLNSWFGANKNLLPHAIFKTNFFNNMFFYKAFLSTATRLNFRGSRYVSLIQGGSFFFNSKFLNNFISQNSLRTLTPGINFTVVPKNLRKNRKSLKKNLFIFNSQKLFLYSVAARKFRGLNKKASIRLFSLKGRKNFSVSDKSVAYLLARLESKLGSLTSAVNLNAFLRAYNLYKFISKKQVSTRFITAGVLTKKRRLLFFKKKCWRFFFKNHLLSLLKGNSSLSSLDKKKVYNLVNYVFKKLTKASKIQNNPVKLRTLKSTKLNNLIKGLNLSCGQNNLNFKSSSKKVIILTKKNVKSSKYFVGKINKNLYESKPKILTRLILFKLKNFKLNKKLNLNNSVSFFVKKRSNSIKKKRFVKLIRVSESFVKLNETQNALGIFISKKVNFFFVNALSFAKYAYKMERLWKNKKAKSPTNYLANLDRFFINKYKYIGIFIKDFVRINFIGMLLKKPTFITRFIAFLIAKLPRNRRETSFIRYLMRVLKIFSAEREEIESLRIKFKGRVNRWRRTKSLVGHRGTLPLSTFENRIIFGSSQAINRKGAIGVSLWMQYNTGFFKEGRASFGFYYKQFIRFSFIKYIKYSKKKVKFLKNYLPFILKGQINKNKYSLPLKIPAAKQKLIKTVF